MYYRYTSAFPFYSKSGSIPTSYALKANPVNHITNFLCGSKAEVKRKSPNYLNVPIGVEDDRNLIIHLLLFLFHIKLNP